MTNPFPVSRKISCLMSPSRQQALHERSVSTFSNVSQCSQMSLQSSTSEFIEAKISALEQEKAYFTCFKDGLDEISASGLLSAAEFQTEIDPVLRRFRTASHTLDVMKHQRRLLEEDLESEVAIKRKRVNEPLDDGLIERAYMDTILPRVMGAAAKMSKTPFNQNKFKKEVNKWYGVTGESSYCHILGYYLPPSSVKAAHLVPKTLSQAELSHIFGVEDSNSMLYDPRNALSLCNAVEALLDQGTIAIVPTPDPIVQSEPVSFRCVVLDDTKNENYIFKKPSGRIIRVKHLDLRPLQFLSDKRPRLRYLYFRFMISYLNVKRLKLGDTAEKVEAKRFWPSAGEYLHKSTLQTLARCISGCELPDEFVKNKTFETSGNESRNQEAGMILGADIRETTRTQDHGVDTPDTRDALIESMKRL